MAGSGLGITNVLPFLSKKLFSKLVITLEHWNKTVICNCILAVERKFFYMLPLDLNITFMDDTYAVSCKLRLNRKGILV